MPRILPRTSKEKTDAGLSQRVVAGLVILTLIASTVIIYLSQMLAERNAFTVSSAISTSVLKEQHEVAKLDAGIRQIRSDTSGSLFWLKMIAVCDGRRRYWRLPGRTKPNDAGAN